MSEMTTQPKGRISVRLTCWNHRLPTNRLPYLAYFNGERHFAFIEKLVVEAGVNLMVGRATVSWKGRQCNKKSKRSQGGVVFLAHEYQATAVSFTKPVNGFCERIYQSVAFRYDLRGRGSKLRLGHNSVDLVK